jgi:hypothetical protein
VKSYDLSGLIAEIQKRWEPIELAIKYPITQDEIERFLLACRDLGIDVEQYGEETK